MDDVSRMDTSKPTAAGDDADLTLQLLKALNQYRTAAAGNPFVNPVQMLALDLAAWLGSGKTSPAEVADMVQGLTVGAFEARAARLAQAVGETDPAANRERLRRRLEAAATTADGCLQPFETFAAAMAREHLGLVITAHPTFGTSARAYRRMARLAAGKDGQGRPLTDAERARERAAIAAEPHRPDENLTLAFEQGMALEAVLAIQDAIRVVYETVLDLARARYPTRWTELTPRLITVASWVGFDLDGRSDIGWNDTLRARLKLQLVQLERYSGRLAALAARLPGGGALGTETGAGVNGRAREPIAVALTLALSRLQLALTISRTDLLVLPENAADLPKVEAFVQHLARSRDSRLTDLGEVVAVRDPARRRGADADLLRDLLVLRAEMANYGLGAAHIHVRCNASQLHNAIRHRVSLERTPDQASSRRRYLAAVSEELDRVEPVTVNFAALSAERTTAKRLFMLIAQILKYIDAATPVRFLIAEANTPFTILAALFYARLFGVADRVDISPLFETDEALERGATVMAELLRNPHYRRYAAQRGRICIQTGYSDAGRFLGQISASMAIERLRMKLARVLAEEGIPGVELVTFDTQGESIGRGGHPGGLPNRFAYLSPPESRALFAARGVAVKQEFSFQGGDGYVYFGDPDLALGTVARLLESVLTPPPGLGLDPFYRETDYSLDFFISTKEFNRSLIDDPDYAALLGAFGTNLLHPTGSRVIRRQHEGKSTVDVEHPSQLRAIPHNAILQQIGYLANAVAGVGTTAAGDLERFATMVDGSDRFRRMIDLVAQAEAVGSLEVLAAYLSLLDPGAWLRRLVVEQDPAVIRRMQRLARLLESRGRHDRLQAGLRRLTYDGFELRRALRTIGKAPAAPDRRRDALDLLHAIRIALIQQLFVLAMRIPRFTSQPEVTPEDILDEVLCLAIDPALSVLHKAFPKDNSGGDRLAGDEPATFRVDRSQGYAQEHQQLFTPIRDCYELIRGITTPISYWCGAVG